jgi:hypothetical protein
MKYLSLWRPWTWAIFDPIANKGIENRPWQPNVDMIGQRFAIQAVPKWDDSAISFFMQLGLDHFPNRKDQYPFDAVVGVVTLDRVVTNVRSLPSDQKRWFFGEYGWVIVNRIALPNPVYCKGVRGLRDLPDDVEREVLKQLAATTESAHVR